MSASPFHMGWFVANGHGPQAWNRPWEGNAASEWTHPQYFVDMAQALERACFDFVMFEDSAMVPDTYGGSFEVYLKNARRAPKSDPTALIPVLGYMTKHLGLVSTMSTSFYNPYHLARLCTTLDHMTGGRYGWNIVTSSSKLSAANYGIELPGHDERYEVADEFVELAEALWDSWEPDAVVRDHATGTYADHTKVHAINFEGKYFKSKGPLNTQPSPQIKPVYVQAGGSGRGRQFAAEHAEAVVCMAKGIPAMKAFREDVRQRMADAGRDPDSCKVLFLIDPVIAETEAEVEMKQAQRVERRSGLDGVLELAGYSDTAGMDFASIDWDAPLAEMKTDGHQALLESMAQTGPTLREAMAGLEFSCIDVAGTPDGCAAQMDEIMQEIGGDGFLITSWVVTRMRIAEIADGLAPALKRRGLTRDEYLPGGTFRDNLLAF
jgi:FMN-dependent oxidoreductase (nitrilotriacetate monooxygenase family)